MWRQGLMAVVFLAFATAVSAQEPWQNWQTEWSGEATIVGASDTDAVLAGSGEAVLFGAKLQFDIDRVLENGLEIGARVAVEGQKDHPNRPGFNGGVPLDCSTACIATQPGFGGAVGPSIFIAPTQRGAYSGLSAYTSGSETDPQVQVETAFVFVKGGYGEARLGRDRGVALWFHEGAPSVFQSASVDNASLDPSGARLVRTDHDLTGPSAKVTLISRRLLGVRAGISFTPNAEAEGLDRNVEYDDGFSQPVSIENAIEVAANASRRLPDSGVRVRAAAAYSNGEASGSITALDRYDRVETWSAGGSLEFETVTVGASVLGSNNGVQGQNGDYSAWSVGITKDIGDFTIGAEYGAAEDELADIDGESWSIGVSKAFNEHVTGTIGYQNHAVDVPLRPLTPGGIGDEDAQGIVVEITLSL